MVTWGVTKSKCPTLDLQSLYERSVTNLSEDQKPLLLGRNADVFSCAPGDLGHTDLVHHKINTGDAAPIRQPPRRRPSLKKDEAHKAITEMLEQGLIESSTSPWASPIVLVKKKDGNWRFCVDYRKLDDVTRKDSYPLPRIDDTLNRLADMQWFLTLDLKSDDSDFKSNTHLSKKRHCVSYIQNLHLGHIFKIVPQMVPQMVLLTHCYNSNQHLPYLNFLFAALST